LVYLTKKIDDAWLYGTCAGYERMFPSNYVNVVVPLPENNSDSQRMVQVESQNHYADVLYQFDAETESDLNLKVSLHYQHSKLLQNTLQTFVIFDAIDE